MAVSDNEIDWAIRFAVDNDAIEAADEPILEIEDVDRAERPIASDRDRRLSRRHADGAAQFQS
jgi:hypothetical protein